MSLRSILLAVTLVFLSADYAQASIGFDESNKAKAELFFASENVMADVDNTLLKAKESGKLALFIIGADWCHDSRAIAGRLDEPTMKSVLDENYEVTLIDVEFFEHGMDVVKRFGQPVIYATPTIMVIDPENEQLVNGHNMHQWRNAQKISLEDSVSYFSELGNIENHTKALQHGSNTELNRLLDEISAFEKHHAARVEHAFTVILAPYLKLDDDELGKDFYSKWAQAKKLRFAMPADLEALRKEAQERTSAGENSISLDYPDYAAFDWE